MKAARSRRTRRSSRPGCAASARTAWSPRPQHGGWFYEISELTPNARISDLQCALGASQLTKLERFVTRRNEIAKGYEELLAGLDVEPAPTAPEGSRHARHLYPVRVPRRRSVYEAMRAAGIGVQVHYVPIYRHPLVRTLRRRPVGLSGDRAGVRRAAIAPHVPGAHRRRTAPGRRDPHAALSAHKRQRAGSPGASFIPPIPDRLLYAFRTFSEAALCGATGWRSPEMDDDQGSGWVTFSAVILVFAGLMKLFDSIWAFRTKGKLPRLAPGSPRDARVHRQQLRLVLALPRRRAHPRRLRRGRRIAARPLDRNRRRRRSERSGRWRGCPTTRSGRLPISSSRSW